MAKDKAPGPVLAPKALRTKWKTLVLVCEECATCQDGTKPKDVRKRLKRLAKAEKPRVRVLECSCLGICPKAGVTTVVCGLPEGNVSRVVRKKEEVEGIPTWRSL